MESEREVGSALSKRSYRTAGVSIRWGRSADLRPRRYAGCFSLLWFAVSRCYLALLSAKNRGIPRRTPATRLFFRCIISDISSAVEQAVVIRDTKRGMCYPSFNLLCDVESQIKDRGPVVRAAAEP